MGANERGAGALATKAFLDRLVADGRTPAAAIAVAVDGQPVFTHFAGRARPGVPAGPETVWPVASISKLYTASAIMRLIEQGRLALNQVVSDVLPGFTGGGRAEVTLRQLLTHTSGLPYESPHHESRLAAEWSVDEMTDEACTAELLFPPGTRQLYSDFGYAIAGRLAAAVTGQPFATLVRTLVLEPAGLDSTWFPALPDIHGRIAIIEGSIGLTPDTAMYNSAYGLGLAHPAFGAVATLSDLLAFGLIFDPKRACSLHSRAALATMTTDQTGADEPAEFVIEPAERLHPWGIGFMLKGSGRSPELVSPRSYGHGGATGCYLWIDPEFAVTIAFVSNRHYKSNPADFMPRLDQVLNVVMSEVTR